MSSSLPKLEFSEIAEDCYSESYKTPYYRGGIIRR